MLREAKQRCDVLIVGIQTDPTIDRPEKNKPVQSVIERQIQVSACRYVDEVIVYTTEQDLITILNTVPIDVRFVGEEYKTKLFTGKNIVPVEYNRRKHAFSSSSLRQRVVDAG
jgi:glycerol-3-phosphate cytidylyltransferase